MAGRHLAQDDFSIVSVAEHGGDLAAAVTAAAAGPRKTVLVGMPVTLTAPLTIPSDVALKVNQGGVD